MSVSTMAGAKVYIGPTTAAADAAAYAALTYAEIGEIESFGEFGDAARDVAFNSLSASRVRHMKGSRDAGSVPVVCGRDPLDAGQIAAIAAEKTKFSYAIKVVFEDKLDANDTNSIYYFHALVQSARVMGGEADTVVKIKFDLGIVTAITYVPATVVP